MASDSHADRFRRTTPGRYTRRARGAETSAAGGAPAPPLMGVANHTMLIVVSAMFTLPFLFVLLTSLMTTDKALTTELWPRPFQWTNYAEVFERLPVLRYAFSIFLLRQFFMTIPEELSDAARVDGGSEWQIMTRVIVPLANHREESAAAFADRQTR